MAAPSGLDAGPALSAPVAEVTDMTSPIRLVAGTGAGVLAVVVTWPELVPPLGRADGPAVPPDGSRQARSSRLPVAGCRYRFPVAGSGSRLPVAVGNQPRGAADY
ncbi:hypothetical protein GCM10022225_64820 [Plantactinospora mayteni]|uniref:Uncharacterized protein n=1 Tax=Plantactinospora mayteni TaxID=566021 RepID=A0ABQ4F0M4_9ACTN|nr:hypothetical protein Pma05_70190 [Plantactinospora mayteni]